MKKFLVICAALVAGLSTINAQVSGCEEVAIRFAGNASVTFQRYRHIEMVGQFSVAEKIDDETGDKSYRYVRFSQGNLQYRASTKKWRFAEQQYDIIASGNENISSAYTGWIDLFGWATSGWNGSGAIEYQPYATSKTNTDYVPTGDKNLVAGFVHCDWAYHNFIINGGDADGPDSTQWRLLTAPEWKYLFESRCQDLGGAGHFYAYGNLMGVHGIYLLPDTWDWNNLDIDKSTWTAAQKTTLSNIKDNWIDGNTQKTFANNTINDAVVWSGLEKAGMVFLPVTGRRYGTTYDSKYDDEGDYYSSNRYTSKNDRTPVLIFSEGSLVTPDNGKSASRVSKYIGKAVRPVQVTVDF